MAPGPVQPDDKQLGVIEVSDEWLTAHEVSGFYVPEPGDTIDGRYRVERLIANGGMSRIYSAVHVALEQRVVIKLMREDLSDREDLIERFQEEARSFACLRGQHVVRVLDLGLLSNRAPYMVLEYLQGSDLCTLLQEKGALAHRTAVAYMLEVCEGLAEVHAAGIVHRDIKPENLFLAEQQDGQQIIKILDFGISKSVASRRRCVTDPTLPIGSPHYMAPEQMRTPSLVDSGADIWAVGAVLYELISGVGPFDAETIPDVYAKVLTQEPAPIRQWKRGVPEGLERVVLRCLAKARAARYSDVSALAQALAPFGHEGAEASAFRVRRMLAKATSARRAPNRRRSDARPAVPAEPVLAREEATPIVPAKRRARAKLAWASGIVGVCAGLGISSYATVRDFVEQHAPDIMGNVSPALFVGSVLEQELEERLLEQRMKPVVATVSSRAEAERELGESPNDLARAAQRSFVARPFVKTVAPPAASTTAEPRASESREPTAGVDDIVELDLTAEAAGTAAAP
jgi:tRNA A-37 threonylcarbamoyl transferase component Bud32